MKFKLINLRTKEVRTIQSENNTLKLFERIKIENEEYEIINIQ